MGDEIQDNFDYVKNLHELRQYHLKRMSRKREREREKPTFTLNNPSYITIFFLNSQINTEISVLVYPGSTHNSKLKSLMSSPGFLNVKYLSCRVTAFGAEVGFFLTHCQNGLDFRPNYIVINLPKSRSRKHYIQF